jgi:sarcosine oxidase subunit alpha
MLREDGLVFDDGTTSRLDECHYFMTTTTSNAAAVLSHMEYYLQVQWPELDVKVTSVTEQWAAMALAGPKSRNVLSKLLPTINVDNESFPFMGVREVDIEGVPARIFRISFSGELSYEINVPADFGEFIWQRILEVGKGYSIRPYGTEAMGIMRIEKGHVAGPELDGRTTATDLGLQKLLSSKKDFIGSKMMDREGLKDENRPRLVGLVPVDKKSRVKSGAILVKDPTLAPPVPKLGHVSSSAYLSPTLGHPISLGFVSGDIIETTKKIWAVSPLHNESHELEITDPVFYDQKSERLHD